MLLREHVCQRAPLLSPTRAPPDSVFLAFHFGVAVPAHWARIGSDAGFNTADLGVVAASDVVVEEAKLPGAELAGTSGAGQPGGGEHVDALLDQRKVTQVVA